MDRILCILLLILFLAPMGCDDRASNQNLPTPLQTEDRFAPTVAPQTPVDRAPDTDIPRWPNEPTVFPQVDQILTFDLNVSADEYVELTIEQQGLDIEVELNAPDGSRLLHLDNPGGPEGPETLTWIASVAGRFSISIRPFADQKPGQVELLPAIRREPSEEDRRYVEVLRRHLDTPAQPAPEDREAWLAERLAQLQRLEGLDRPMLRARIERGYGWLAFHQGLVRRALESFRAALPAVRHHGTAWELTALLNDLGYAARLSGEPDLARSALEESLERADAIDHQAAAATALNNLGVLSQALGDLEEALRYYDLAIERWHRLGDLHALGATLHNIGLGYLNLGRFDDATGHLERSLELRRETGDLSGEALTLSAVAWVRSLEGDHHRALGLYNQSLVLLRSIGDPRAEAATLDQRGAAFRAVGRNSEAMADFEAALDLLQQSGNLLSEAHVLANLAETLLELGQVPRAEARQRQALKLFQSVIDRQGEARALTTLARIAQRRQQPAVARGHYERALELVESIRGRLQSPVFRRSYTAARYNAYSSYIDLLIEFDQIEPGAGHSRHAFEVVERARAKGLREGLGGERGWWRRADPELRHQEQKLRQRINLLEERRIELFQTPSPTDAVALLSLEDEIQSLVQSYAKLEGHLRESAEAASVPLHNLTVAETQALLGPETTLLSYHLGNHPVVWRLEAERFSMHRLDTDSVAIDSLAERTRRSLARSRLVGSKTQALRNTEALALRVLAPVARNLETRVVIVAEGALAAVPFGALPVASSEPAEPLLMRHSIVHLPSVSVLPLLRRGDAPPRSSRAISVAIFADPVFAPDDSRLEIVSPSSQQPPDPIPLNSSARGQNPESRALPPLRRLPASRTEADALLEIISRRGDGSNGRLWKGFEATLDPVQGGELTEFDIVHFATHGWIDDAHPGLSGIVLSRFDTKGRPRRGFLRVHEIERLVLPSDLVVLSACQTALGETVRGEGIVGLAHAFFRAGTRRLVVSHWRVDDQATAALMQRFYKHLLLDQDPPAEALAKAQRWLRTDTEWHAPAHWSAFTLQGDWR